MKTRTKVEAEPEAETETEAKTKEEPMFVPTCSSYQQMKAKSIATSHATLFPIAAQSAYQILPSKQL